MEATRAEALDRLISQLDVQIIAAEHLGIPSAKLLLAMARLDLQTKRHGINDEEFCALCATLERALTGIDRSRRQHVPSMSRRHHGRPTLVRLAGPIEIDDVTSGKSRR
jgi:hypothetical protein